MYYYQFVTNSRRSPSGAAAVAMAESEQQSGKAQRIISLTSVSESIRLVFTPCLCRCCCTRATLAWLAAALSSEAFNS